MPFVGDDRALDAPDSPVADAARQRVEIRDGERWVAVAREIEVAVPNPRTELARAKNLGSEAKRRSEHPERGERNSELLRGRRGERERRIPLEHHVSGPNIDGERSRLPLVDAG